MSGCPLPNWLVSASLRQCDKGENCTKISIRAKRSKKTYPTNLHPTLAIKQGSQWPKQGSQWPKQGSLRSKQGSLRSKQGSSHSPTGKENLLIHWTLPCLLLTHNCLLRLLTHRLNHHLHLPGDTLLVHTAVKERCSNLRSKAIPMMPLAPT